MKILNFIFVIFLAGQNLSVSPLTLVRELNETLRSENLTQEQVEEKLRRSIDAKKIATEAIRGLTKGVQPEKLREYEETFVELFYKSSVKKILKQKADKVFYRGEECEGEKQCRVPTRVRFRGEEAEITYFLFKKDSRWIIYDIVVDGTSITENYKKQFSKIVEKEGFDSLLRKLKRKMKEVEE